MDTGRCSMISAIFLNGEFLWLIRENTGNSKKFRDFIYILNYALQFAKMNKMSECAIILDNASIHCSDSTINLIKKININWIFLPAYSLMLVSVELFFSD